MYNKLITKQGKMIKEEDIPEVDLGPIMNVEALKDNRFEIFNGQDDNDKRLTCRIFLNFNPTAPLKLSPCDGDCCPPMRDLMSSKKLANDMIRSCFLGNKIDTGNKVMASMSAYTDINMDQQNLRNHEKG